MLAYGPEWESAKLTCDLCRAQNPPDWQEILQYFRGSELQNYFTRILEDDLATVKPQYVDNIPKAVRCPPSRHSSP